jgi:hypothetical protein
MPGCLRGSELLLRVAALLLGVPAELLSRVSGDGTNDGVYASSGANITQYDQPRHIRHGKKGETRTRGLTLLSDDPVDGTLGVLLGLGSLDLGFSLVVPLLSVLGQDARLGGSSDGLELWT